MPHAPFTYLFHPSRILPFPPLVLLLSSSGPGGGVSRNPGDVEVRFCTYWFRSSFECTQGFAGLLLLDAGGSEHRGAVIYSHHYANRDILKALYS